MRQISYDIENDFNGWTVKEYLLHLGFSVSLLRQLKNNPQGIKCNNFSVFVTKKLSQGDCLTITLEEEHTKNEAEPIEGDLSVVYEDQDILVLDKPAGMPTHPSFQNRTNTLSNLLAFRCEQQKDYFLFRAINRLDKNTTGLVLLAKNAISASIIGKSSRENKIKKQYLALCSGITPEAGKILAPIGRLEGSIIKRKVDFYNGESSITHFERLWHDEKYSFLRLWLETGRTHQIRVHMAFIGHPLVGDFLYSENSISKINRHALHCFKMEFEHPVKKEKILLKSPLPLDMKCFFNQDEYEKILKMIDEKSS